MTLRWYWVAAFAVFVVCIPLFAWNHVFYCDWPNHIAMIGYVGQYLRAHGTLPAMFHSNTVIGRPTPMFYGSLYLPPLGLLSAFFGPRAALTAGAVGLLGLQFGSVRALFRDVTQDEALSCAAAVMVTWAIYPLTDLYNRAALTEFIAITALQSGACLWILYARDPARRGRVSVGAGLLLTLACGIHPPTALFGGLTFGALWLGSLLWCPDRPRLLRRTFAIVVAAAGVLAPWLYVVAKFGKLTQIVQIHSTLWFFRTSLDMVATRLSLVPTVGPEGGAVSTPNLDPQIGVPIGAAALLLVIVAAVNRARVRGARRELVFAGICAATAAALFVFSTSPATWKVLPKAFEVIQFAYRLVAFVNLALLGALLGMLAALSGQRFPIKTARAGVMAALVVTAFSVGLKLPRCLEGGMGADSVVTDYANPPRAWYFGDDDYSTSEAFAKVDATTPKQGVPLAVGPPQGFGVVHPARVHLDARTLLTTNVTAFPWNVLTIDGRAVTHDATFSDGVRLATWAEAGDHEIGYRFRPDRWWVVLRAASLTLLTLWAIVAIFGPALRRFVSRVRRQPILATSEARPIDQQAS